LSYIKYVSNWYDFIIQLNSDVNKLIPIIQKKSEIIEQVISEKKPDADTIIAFGLTPEIINLAALNYKITVLEKSLPAKEFSKIITKKLNLNITILDEIPDEKYDVVLGLDQYITYLDTPETQQEHISSVFDLLYSGGLYLNTIRDYKNIKTNKFVDEVFTMRDYYIIETRVWSNQTNYKKTILVITKTDNSTKLLELGPVNCRTIMFKDLARLCTANGGKNFQVHQNKIYKPMYSKTFQHMVTAEKE